MSQVYGQILLNAQKECTSHLSKYKVNQTKEDQMTHLSMEWLSDAETQTIGRGNMKPDLQVNTEPGVNGLKRNQDISPPCLVSRSKMLWELVMIPELTKLD